MNEFAIITKYKNSATFNGIYPKLYLSRKHKELLDFPKINDYVVRFEYVKEIQIKQLIFIK